MRRAALPSPGPGSGPRSAADRHSLPAALSAPPPAALWDSRARSRRAELPPAAVPASSPSGRAALPASFKEPRIESGSSPLPASSGRALTPPTRAVRREPRGVAQRSPPSSGLLPARPRHLEREPGAAASPPSPRWRRPGEWHVQSRGQRMSPSLPPALNDLYGSAGHTGGGGRRRGTEPRRERGRLAPLCLRPRQGERFPFPDREDCAPAPSRVRLPSSRRHRGPGEAAGASRWGRRRGGPSRPCGRRRGGAARAGPGSAPTPRSSGGGGGQRRDGAAAPRGEGRAGWGRLSAVPAAPRFSPFLPPSLSPLPICYRCAERWHFEIKRALCCTSWGLWCIL